MGNFSYKDFFVFDFVSSNNAPNGEIIEASFAILDSSSFETKEEEYFFIKPTNVDKVSETFLKANFMSYKDLQEGILLEDFFLYLKDFGPKFKPWITWSEKERRLLESECKNKNLNFPLTSKHLNLKTLFSLTYSLEKDLSFSKLEQYLSLNPAEENLKKLCSATQKIFKKTR